VIDGDRSDVTSLGIAIIEARGDVKLAEIQIQGLEQARKLAVGSVSESDLRSAKIKRETAMEKLNLLSAIAKTTYELAKNELDADLAEAEQVQKLAERGYVSKAEVDQRLRRARATQGKLEIMQAIIGK